MDANATERLADFLRLCTEIQRTYVTAYEIVGECDRCTTDYLHRVELDCLKTAQLAQVAKAQRDNLKARRKAKDVVELLEPLYRLLTDDKRMSVMDIETVLNHLREVLGKMRKIEQYHETCTYIPRHTAGAQ